MTPLNWAPSDATLVGDGTDGKLRPVNLMRLVSPIAKSHRLLTRIRVIPAGSGAKCPWSFGTDRAIEASCGRRRVTITPGKRPALNVSIRAGGRQTLAAVCNRDVWQVTTGA